MYKHKYMNKKEFDILRSREPEAFQYVDNGVLEGPNWEGIKGLYFLSNNQMISKTLVEKCARNLQILLFEEGVVEIEERAFFDHRCEHIVLPSSLKYLGAEAFYSKSLLSIDLPNIFLKEILSNNLLNEFHFVGDYLFCKKNTLGGQHIYIKTTDFDYDLFELFEDLSSVHISTPDASILLKTSVVPKLINTIYVSSKSMNFEHTTEYLKDLSGNIIFVKKKKKIAFGPWYTYISAFPEMEYMSKKSIEYSIFANPNFAWNHGIIKNNFRMVVYIPNKKKIMLNSCELFSPNVLINHFDIEELIIINYNLDLFDVSTLVIALQLFEESCKNPKTAYLHWKRPLNIIVPKDSKFGSIPLLFGSSNYMRIKVEDVDEPDEFIE